MSNNNRWGIAVAGFLMQMTLGAVYAWSVFRAPLTKQFHWSIEEVTLTFTISIFVLGVSAFFGGLWLNIVSISFNCQQPVADAKSLSCEVRQCDSHLEMPERTKTGATLDDIFF